MAVPAHSNPYSLLFAHICDFRFFSLCLFSIFSLLARQLPFMQLLSRQIKYYEVYAEKKTREISLFPLPRRGHLRCSHRASKFTLTLYPDVDFPVRPPGVGVNTAPGVRGLGVEGVIVLEIRTGATSRTRGAGGKRLQANRACGPGPR